MASVTLVHNQWSSETVETASNVRVSTNFLIRRKLFRELLTPTTLLACRLVCKEWEAEARSALQRVKLRRGLRITFRYSFRRQTFVSFNQNRSGRTLREFLVDRNGNAGKTEGEEIGSQFLQECCPFYAFHGGNVGVDQDAIEFFINPNSNIQGLIFRFNQDHRPYLSLTILRNLLLRWGKSLKHLHLKNKPLCWNETYDRLILPNDDPSEMHVKDTENVSITLPNDLRPSFEKYSRQLYNYFYEQTPEFPEMDFLPALEFLKMYDLLCTFNIDLLNWAPNLKTFVDHDAFNIWQIHRDSKKLHALDTWRIYSLWTSRSERNKLADLPLESLPELKKFGFCTEEQGFTSTDKTMINRILERGQKSLVKLWDVLEFFRQPGIILPRMENVKRVTQHHVQRRRNESKDKVEENLLDLSQLLPNIEHLELNRRENLCDPTDMQIIDEFDSCLPLTSISRCSFWFQKENIQSLTMERIEKVKRLCPNLRYIHFSLERVPEELPELFLLIWKKFPEICSLTFHFRYTEPFKIDCRYPPVDKEQAAAFLEDQGWRDRLDCAMTGFDVETCQEVRFCQQMESGRGLKSEPKVPGETRQRCQPSLLDMQKLEYLEIKIGPFASPFRLFSATSFQFGFDLMRMQRNFVYNFSPQLL